MFYIDVLIAIELIVKLLPEAILYITMPLLMTL